MSFKDIVVIVDTVYLTNRSFGLMMAKDSKTDKTLERTYVLSETIDNFINLIEKIKNKGINIKALVVDGRIGILKAYPQIPTQMC